MAQSEQVKRIRQMEAHLNTSKRALDRLSLALSVCESVMDRFEALAEYYESELWMQDYDADAAGLLPADLKRGVLSEDAVYHLLEEAQELSAALRQFAGRLRGEAADE